MPIAPVPKSYDGDLEHRRILYQPATGFHPHLHQLAWRACDAFNGRVMVEKNERPIVAVNLIYITGLTAVALRRENYEFVLYAGVVAAFLILILVKQRTVRFDRTILWGLTLWGLAHMAGGNIRVGDGVLYDVQLIPVVLRYDQLVHFFGFGTATLVCHHLLRPYLRRGITRWGTLSILIVLMGCGLGAVNEVVEFVAVLLIPETGVGGYGNTLWDLVFNLLGASVAVIYLAIRRRSATCVVS